MIAEEIRNSIFDLLSADSGLSAIVSGIYYNLAPDIANEPFIVFSRVSGLIEQKFNAGSFENQLWLIKVLAKGTSTQSAGEICNAALDRILAVLQNTIAATSGTVIFGRANQQMPDFTETRSDAIIYHQGLYFDVRVEKNG
jgi:hypothetical protein